jgi:TRAP transporter TAXI family solute receptor
MKRLLAAVAWPAAAAALFAAPAHAQVLGIGTAPAGSIGYNMGSAIAKVLAEKAQVQARVQPYSGSSAVFPLVNSGEVDLTVGNALETQEAAEGEGPYSGRKQDKLRVLGVLFPLNVGLFVKKDAPIASIADLKGRRVVYGFTAQVTINRVINGILANGGISGSDISPVMVPNVIRGADDFAEGKADAGFFAIGAGKVAEVDKTTGGIRFISMSDDPKAVAAMRRYVPYAYINEVKPAPPFAGVVGPTKLMAYDYLLVANTRVTDDMAYKVVSALHANKEALVESFRPFGAFRPEQMHKEVPAPYHPGALKFYKEKGLMK